MAPPLRVRLAAMIGGCGAVVASGPAWACTTCNSDVAQAVRAQLLDANLLANAAAVLAPIPLLAAALILVGARTSAGDKRGGRDG